MAIGAAVFTAGGSGQNFTTTSPKTFTTTPTTAPRAVLVAIVQDAGTDDTITAVSYGGVALTRIIRAVDAAGEIGTAEIWFVGSGIPFPGTQTVSITHTGLATTKTPFAVGYEAGGNTEVVDSDKVEGDVSNPSVALDSGAVEAIRVGAVFSGHNAPSSLAVLTGMTAVSTVDFGTTSGRYDRQTSNSTGSFTFGYTAGGDDTALVGIAIAEITGTAHTRTVESIVVSTLVDA